MYNGPGPAPGSTKCTCGPRRCSNRPGLLLEGRRRARHRARVTTGRRDVQVAATLPDVNEVFDRTARTAMRCVPDGLADPARRRPDRHRARHPGLGAPRRMPMWNSYYSSRLTRTRQAPRVRGGRQVSTSCDRDGIAKTHDLVTGVHVGHEPDTTSPCACALIEDFLQVLTKTGTCALQGIASGQGDQDAVERNCTRAGGDLPGSGRRCCTLTTRGAFRRGDGASVGAPDRLARTRARCGGAALVSAMDECARSRRPGRCSLARSKSCGSGSAGQAVVAAPNSGQVGAFTEILASRVSKRPSSSRLTSTGCGTHRAGSNCPSQRPRTAGRGSAADGSR